MEIREFTEYGRRERMRKLFPAFSGFLILLLTLMSCGKPSESNFVYPEYFQFPIVVDKGDGKYLTIWTHTDTKISQYPKVYILEIDGNGNRVWEKEYGFGDKNYGQPYVAAKMTNGDFIIAGVPYPSPGIFIARIDGRGNIIWSKEYTYPNYEDYILYFVNNLVEVENGVIFLSAGIFSGVDFRASGITFRVKSFSLGISEVGNIIREFDWGVYGFEKSGDGGLITIKVYNSSIPPVYNWKYNRIVKLDRNLEIVWDREVSSPVDGNEIRFYALHRVGDEYVAVGQIQSDSSKGPMVLVKFDENGNILMTKLVSGIDNIDNFIGAVIDDGIYTAISVRLSAKSVINVAKIDFEGNILWRKELSKYLYAEISPADDGVILFLKDSENYMNLNVVKMNSAGDILWQRSFENSQTAKIILSSDGNYILLLEGLRFAKISRDGQIIIYKNL